MNYSNCSVLVVAILAIMIGGSITKKVEAKSLKLSFACSAKNDLYRVVTESSYQCSRFDTAAEAIDKAERGSGVLVLADGYPETRTNVDAAVFGTAAEKGLRLYVEYPAQIPPSTSSGCLETGEVKKIEWERAVVASDAFGDKLPKLHIMSISGCRFIPMKAADPLMVMARVAGYDTAVYGIPDSASPILFRLPEHDALIATTKLSGFITGRYAPNADWGTFWEKILSMLDPESTFPLKWTPTVHPAYGKDEKLPADVERSTLAEGVGWYLDSQLIVRTEDKDAMYELLMSGAAPRPVPRPYHAAGDGSCGVLEGYSAGMDYDGNQLQLISHRADCNAEVAMALAVGASISGDKHCREIAANLLRYIYADSGMCGGDRGNPKHPSFGLISWGGIVPAWTCANYGDDNARCILGTMVASACLDTNQWDEYLLRAVLANLRTTGKLGFREDRVDMAPLEEHGWKYYQDAENLNYAPHFDSYLWACNLWAYKHTGYQPLLDSTKNAIRMTMEVFPKGWRWNDSIERARILLCLAWLILVEDTPEHRGWLKTITDDFLSHQQPCGALPERIGGMGGGHYVIPATNEEYGTAETPLIQKDGDPATDQLYTTGFALLGLHEAVAATGDVKLKAAEDKLTHYLCRIQVRSKDVPYLDGTWFRAFDYKRWDYWASSADLGWGAWSAESGWGTAWINAILGLRIKGTSVWDITSNSKIADHMSAVQKQMAENDGEPWKK